MKLCVPLLIIVWRQHCWKQYILNMHQTCFIFCFCLHDSIDLQTAYCMLPFLCGSVCIKTFGCFYSMKHSLLLTWQNQSIIVYPLTYLLTLWVSALQTANIISEAHLLSFTVQCRFFCLFKCLSFSALCTLMDRL